MGARKRAAAHSPRPARARLEQRLLSRGRLRPRQVLLPPHIKLPAPVAAIYRAVAEHEAAYPGRRFTPDGHQSARLARLSPPRLWASSSIRAAIPYSRAFGEGFRTPAPCGTVVRVVGPAFESLPRRKPRGCRGAVWSGATYGDFRIADGSRVSPRGPVARNLGGGNDDDERVRSRGCAALARARWSGED